MNYEVYCDGKLIAQFINCHDAEYFLIDCQERYKDYEFTFVKRGINV